MNPESAIIIMFIASFVIGYITMPIMIGFNSPYPLNDYRQTSLSEACAVITPMS